MFGKREFLQRRSDRAVAAILSFKDQQCDPYLPPEVSTKLRQLILDNIRDLCDLAIDMVSGDVEFNEFYWEKMEQILEAANKRNGK